MTEQESRRGKSRRERVEFARSRDILDVANELQMELVRSGRDYRWKEHDSLVISPDKNLWKWFSRNTGGDAISLVETIKEVSFNQSVDFLNDGNFKEFQMVERPQEDFKYYLEKYEQPFSAGRDYLRNQRGLSDETIDYFLEQGVLAQANAKLDYFAEGNDGVTTNAIEPAIVFKSLSSSGEVVGASLQGIQENWEKWPKHGYAKVIMKNSDPMTGIHVDIGSPKRLIFTESPIDLMSYYELHKDSLQDVRLVSMDGLKESTIGRHLSQIQAEISGKPLRWTPEQLADGLQVAIDHHFFEDGKNADLITLALDNDEAGRTFIQELEAKGAVINSDLPELRPGQDKTDWNDVLKNQQEEKPDNSRLAQARRKLERLRGEQDEAISRAYSHQSLTNGQPMNDKRGGASFKRKQEQIEDQVFSKMDEIRQQEERGSVPPELFVAFDFTENPNLSQKFSSGDVIPYKDFIAQLYEENNLRMLNLGYDKTYFALQDEKGSRLTDDFRYDIGSEDSDLSTQLGETLPTPYLEQAQKADHDYQSQISAEENVQTESVESEEKAPESSQEQMNDRTSGGTGSLQPKAEGSTSPVLETSTFEQTVTSHPTSSYPYLHFSTNYDKVQRRVGNYHPITPADLRRLNQYAPSIQSTASWYLSEMAGSKISFVYADHGEENVLQVTFQKENFIHLSGIRPFEEGKGAADFLEDFAAGRGHYDGMLISNSIKDKLQVLPMLQDILEPQSFVLDDLSSVEKLHNLNMSEAIKAKDEDFLLLFKDIGDEKIPASLMKLKGELATSVKLLDEKIILGVYRERDGHIEQLSINEEYVKDGGEEMLSVLKNKQYEEVSEEPEPPAPENTLNKTSLDSIYKENYHVRLQWSEDRPGGPKLPFKETELISYQDFARELYKANQSFYSLHQEGLKQATDGHVEGYIAPTKIQFSIYAPDGELIQDSIRYNIGEEINPIAHKERLGTREMREYPELMKIDGTIFTPYHLERLASELDISQFSYALEDTLYADQLLSQLPFGDLENSPIGFTDSSHDGRLGFISFDGMDSVEVENLSAWFEKLGVKDSPMEQSALIEKWQKEIKGLSEKVEQTISTVREEFEKSQEEEIKLEEQGYNKQELEHDADADGVSDEEELLQGTNPYDFRSKPGSKPKGEESLQADEIVLAAGSLAVADFIQNKDMAGLSRHLKEGIKEFLDSDKYKDYLTKMSQLNNYSNRNLRLILAQNPEARQVASFKQWKENFGRYVKKGEKALRIFKPMTKIKKDENNQPILDKNGKPETVTFFGLVPVFDVSQTEGKEMPKAAEVKEQLTDLDYANLYRALMAIAKENDVSVRFEEMENNKHGYYSVPENQIVLRSNEMNKAQIIKTFLHEMAHAELHHADNPQKENLTRSTAELQAESVAYVVSSYYGIDTSEYSFNYLSGWSADKETLADLEAQLDIVQQEAKSLMVRMDKALEQLRLSQEKQTKLGFEQKLEKFKDQSKQAVEEHKQELKADAQSKKEKGFSK